MKIQTLTIHNIASIEYAQIDFDQAPLAKEPLFLITGETGSGKTTILNAICLALYNQVPALKSIGTAEVDKDGLQTNNPRQLLRRGTGEAEIKLTFIGNNKKQYSALWRVQRARKKITGNYQSIVRQLQIKITDAATKEEKTTTLTRKDEIEQEILQAIGLTFEQFTRTTLLAQGEFATFMKASDNEKSEILEKLTGTEIYARIGQRVFALMQAKTDEYKAIDNQIHGVTLLTPEEKEAMRQKIVVLTEQCKKADAELKTLDAQIAWLTEAAKLQATLAEKITEQQKAESTIASDDYKQKKATVSHWEETTEIRDLINKEKEEGKELAQLKQKRDNLSATFVEITGGIEWQKLQLQQTTQTKAELDKTLEADAENASMYANSGQIKVLANNVAGFVDEHQRLIKELAVINSQKEKSLALETTLQTALKDATEKFTAQEAEVKKQEDAQKDIDLQAMTRRVCEIGESILKANDGIRLIKLWQQAKNECEEATRLLDESLTEQSALQKTIEQNKEKLPGLELEYAAKHGYLEGQMQLNDHISELRQRFQQQNTCPLCGSHDVQLYNDEELSKHLSAAKEQDAIAKKALDDTKDALTKAEAEMKGLVSVIKSREAQAEQKYKAKEVAETSAKTACPNYASGDAIAILETQLKQLEEERKKEQLLLDTATASQNALKEARQALESLRVGKDKATEEYNGLTQKTKELAQQCVSMTDNIAKAKENADKALSEMSQLLTAETIVTLENAKSVSKKIETRAAAFTANQKKAQELSAALETQANQIKANESAMSAMASHFHADKLIAPKEVKDLSRAITNFITEVNTIDGGIQQTNKCLEALTNSISAYFARQETYTKDQVLELSKLSRDTISLYKQYVEAADKQLVATASAAKAISGQIEAHNKQRPQIEDGITQETLTEARSQKQEERNAANNELVAINTQLDKDKQLATSLEEKYKLLERLQKEKNNWEILDKAFGGADGKKFRNIAQSYVLRALLSKANQYLAQLNNRYQLDCEDGSLTINVIDKNQGDAIRNVGLLSGGEGFIVSLALALGLSSISSSSLNVDTLFIDEGFGTLSSDYLETVINTLDRLHLLGGRRVGIISHVDGLKERIPTQICLRRTGPSSSEIAVLSL